MEFWCKILPEIAAASAAVKLGSFVKEDAICSTKNCLTSGESILGFDCLASVLDFGLVKSRVRAGPDELGGTEEGGELRVTERLEPDVASAIEGLGWLCSPS